MAIYLTAFQAKKILSGEGKISLDLGLTLQEEIPEIPQEILKEVAKDAKSVYIFEDGKAKKMAFFSGHFYKLVPTGGAPTIEIDGIRMHRTKGMTPDEDARSKVASLQLKAGEKVLDTCCGLGYTAIFASDSVSDSASVSGKAEVVTVEKDGNVLEMAKLNPWSRRLFSGGKIRPVEGDVFQVIRRFLGGSFDAIVHDPPRFALAGELYSSEFYREMHRVLKPGGRMFHYTGEPGRLRGIRFVSGVVKRLKECGFAVEERKELLGVLAFKLDKPKKTRQE